jgi:hypothetical protein
MWIEQKEKKSYIKSNYLRLFDNLESTLRLRLIFNLNYLYYVVNVHYALLIDDHYGFTLTEVKVDICTSYSYLKINNKWLSDYWLKNLISTYTN